MFGEQIRNSTKKGGLLYGSSKCMWAAIHCNHDSAIITTVNSTHLTVQCSKAAKIHKTTYSCCNAIAYHGTL